MRRRLALPAAAVLLLGVTACSDEGGGDAEEEEGTTPAAESIEGLTVTGDFGKAAEVEVDGLDVEEATSAVLVTGEGEEIDAALRRIYAV